MKALQARSLLLSLQDICSVIFKFLRRMEKCYNQKTCHGSAGYECHVYKFPIVNTRSIGSLICQCFVTQCIVVVTVRKDVIIKFLI